MSDELRAWIANARRVFDLSNSTEPVTDDDERRLHFDMADWAATYGPKLMDKVEELAAVLEADRGFFRQVANCDKCREAMSLFCIRHSVKLVEVAGKRFVALRAPGGGKRGLGRMD